MKTTHSIQVCPLRMVICCVARLFLLAAPAAFAQHEQAMSFRPTTAYSAGGQFGNGVAIADVNADGKPDLIVTNGYDGAIPGNGGVGVLLGNGDGTFQAAITYDTGESGSFAMTIAVGDFNNDGKLDLAVTNTCGDSYCGFANGSVAILLGNGDGTFRTAVNYQTGGESWSVKTADLNRDGKPDLLVGNSNASVAVLLGNGDGTFLPAVGYQSHGIASNSIDVADLDGDGRLDLIVADYCSLTCASGGGISVLLGNGDGTFNPATFFATDGLPHALVVADVNADGKADLVVAIPGNLTWNTRIEILLGNGDGTFQLEVTYRVAGAPFSVTVADLDGDGKADIIAGINWDIAIGEVSIFRGNGDGTFLAPVQFRAAEYAAGIVAVGDLNGDGRLDLAVAGACNTFECLTGTANFVSVLLTKYSTTNSLSSSLNPSIYGQKVTFTATVANNGGVPPTGTVVFTENTYTVGSARLDSSGVATFTRSNLNALAYPLVAMYKGDSNNLSSASPVLNQVINPTTTKATLRSSPNSSTFGEAVTFTAKITSPTVLRTGPVAFQAGKTVLGTAQLGAGTAAFTTSALPLGSTVVTVTYQGNSNIKASSAAVTQTVR